jgi:hypothetical protein
VWQQTFAALEAHTGGEHLLCMYVRTLCVCL